MDGAPFGFCSEREYTGLPWWCSANCGAGGYGQKKVAQYAVTIAGGPHSLRSSGGPVIRRIVTHLLLRYASRDLAALPFILVLSDFRVPQVQSQPDSLIDASIFYSWLDVPEAEVLQRAWPS